MANVDRVGQLQAIHSAGHLNIENKRDISERDSKMESASSAFTASTALNPAVFDYRMPAFAAPFGLRRQGHLGELKVMS
jgi:hypothetical protein